MKDIRQMIRRDCNHPSVLLWEVSLNGTYPDANFRCKQANFFTSDDSYFSKACWDVPYDEWNGDPGKRNNTTYKDRPFLIREYGDYEFGGGGSSTRKLRSSGEQGMLQQAWNFQWEHNKNRKSYPSSLGDLIWVFYDGIAGYVVGIEGWGVTDIFRIPKYSYYFFKSQQPVGFNPKVPEGSGPMVFIASNWSQSTDSGKVIVYSNCSYVSLFLNGKKIAIKHADEGSETGYGGNRSNWGHTFNEGNANNLTYPPFTFEGIVYQPGRMTAVGFNSDKPAAEFNITNGKMQRFYFK